MRVGRPSYVRTVLLTVASVVRPLSTMECTACTFVNKQGALQCGECRAPLVMRDANMCPQCTLLNEALNTHCSACGALLQEWTCPTCCCTQSELEDAGQRIELATPCCCRACVECHRKWIEEQDSKRKDATCLMCNSVLDVEAIRSILGAEAFNARADALVGRITGPTLHDCPTPDCGNKMELDADVAIRHTVCAKCGNLVKLGTDSWCAVIVQEGQPAAGGVPSLLTGAPNTAANHLAAPAATTSSEAPVTSAGSGSRADDPIALSDDCSASSDDDETPLRQRMTTITATTLTTAGVGSKQPRREERTEHEEADQGKDDATGLGPVTAAAPPPLLLPAGLRQCPSCRQGVEKAADSCDKFECLCGFRFCWRCGAAADERGRTVCDCTGSDHTFWDNVKNRPGPQTKRPRKR